MQLNGTKKNPKLKNSANSIEALELSSQISKLLYYRDKFKCSNKHLKELIKLNNGNIDSTAEQLRRENKIGHKNFGEKEISRLEKRIVQKLGFLPLIALSFSILFFSPNLTGNTIANLNGSSSNIIGIILLIIGAIGLYFLKGR
jgi:hypothetical protein|tara:strand:+ start:2862 stop:3293 length:432 start_codon:yes stop_codon:yes gene_type:complete